MRKLTENTKNPGAPGSHKLAWSVCAILFGLSLFAVITTTLKTFVWVRHHGSTPPPSLHAMAVVSHWALGLSALSILVLATISILHAARSK